MRYRFAGLMAFIFALFAVPAMAQDPMGTPPPGLPWWANAIWPLLPFLIGPLVTAFYDKIQVAWAWLGEKVPTWLKPFVAAMLGGLAMLGIQKLGAVVSGGDPTQWNPSDWNAVITAIVSLLFKLGTNQKAQLKALNVDAKASVAAAPGVVVSPPPESAPRLVSTPTDENKAALNKLAGKHDAGA